MDFQSKNNIDKRAQFTGPSSIALAKFAGFNTSTAQPSIGKSVAGVTKPTKSMGLTKGMPSPTKIKTPGQTGKYTTKNFAKMAGANMMREQYIRGVVACLEKTAMIHPDNSEVVVGLVKTANPAAIQAAAGAAPEELQHIQDSGLTSKDLESAAKVVQVMAEMKANADVTGIQQQEAQPPMGGMGAQMGGMPGTQPPQQVQSQNPMSISPMNRVPMNQMQ